ncbi:hypothetical protein [Pinibacter soli]|uniref:Uncharacterized protein n=1 Tax=Pinibacter soli TaxID=3044211 RepID=A0ABT6R879_9BACT|nr:hypothetical protein [Pinibacter soli]MDI3318769.1 hypothetical protein [Pinibacter soli]
MNKKILFALSVLVATQSIYSQNITTAKSLNDKLLQCSRVWPGSTAAYFMEYTIRGNSLEAVDTTNMIHGLFTVDILAFYKTNAAHISWKSIVDAQAFGKQKVKVIHPVFVLTDCCGDTSYSSDQCFLDVKKMFFDKVFNAKGTVIMMEPLVVHIPTIQK